MDFTLLLLHISLFTAANMISSYQINARRQGWPIGTAFEGYTWLFGIAAFGALVATVGSVIANPWWSVFLVLITGTFLGSIFSMILKVRTQIFSVFLLFASWILLTVYCYF